MSSAAHSYACLRAGARPGPAGQQAAPPAAPAGVDASNLSSLPFLALAVSFDHLGVAWRGVAAGVAAVSVGDLQMNAHAKREVHACQRGHSNANEK